MINELVGKVLKSIDVNNDNDRIIFTLENDNQYLMYHSQDCCESVMIEDIVGNLNDLIGVEILVAEERSNSNDPPISSSEDSYTWTFYEFRTIKGSVTIRWYGSSNGYYSESVNFARMK